MQSIPILETSRHGRGLRRWRRARARLGLFAVWVAIAFWAAGASFEPPADARSDAQPDAATLANVSASDAFDASLAPSIDTEGALSAADAETDRYAAGR